MAKRFFISDLHFNSSVLVESKVRDFENVDIMNQTLIDNINKECSDDDILIHLGDLCQYGYDRIWNGYNINPKFFLKQINPTVVNIKGNHDDSNKVKSICDSMRTTLGKKYTAVSVSHYPSNHPKSVGTFHRGDIRLHGHIHCKIDDNENVTKPPKFSIDFKNAVLNINLNCELWDYKPISEDQLISFDDEIMKNHGKPEPRVV